MWRKGTFTIDGISLAYEAKVFDEGSELGINHGRISKLSICLLVNGIPQWDSEIIGYDRGWYKKPENELDNRALEYVLELYK